MTIKIDVKSIRDFKGLSNREFAKLLEPQPSIRTVEYWVSGQKKPSGKYVLQLLEISKEKDKEELKEEILKDISDKYDPKFKDVETRFKYLLDLAVNKEEISQSNKKLG